MIRACTGVAALALAAGCDARDPTAPVPNAPAAPRLPGAPRMVSVLGGGTVTGGSLSDWESATGLQSVNIVVGEGDILRIHVKGSVTVSPNPAFVAGYCQHPFANKDPCGFREAKEYGSGGLGNMTHDLLVEGRLTHPDGTVEYLGFTPNPANPLGDATRVVRDPGTVTISRSPMVREFSWGDEYGKVPVTAQYTITPSFDVTAEMIHPVSSTPDRTRALPYEVVTFTADAAGQRIDAVEWAFAMGPPEMLPDRGYPWANQGVMRMGGCENPGPCPVRMGSRGGRMYTHGTVEGVWTDWVAGPYVNVGPPALKVTCTPPRVPQGVNTTCKAFTEPGAAFTVQSWSYSGVPVPAAPTGDVKQWTFAPQPAGTGTVTVTALVDGVQQTATTQVEVVCNFFRDTTGDSVLDNADVQAALQRLWQNSNVDGPAAQRREQGAYLLERGGSYSALDYAGPATRCSADPGTVKVNFADIAAVVHTHPDMSGPVPTDGSCHGNTATGATFRDGPSADYDLPQSQDYNVKLGRNIPAYVIDSRHVHRYGQGFRARSFPRNGSCVR